MAPDKTHNDVELARLAESILRFQEVTPEQLEQHAQALTLSRLLGVSIQQVADGWTHSAYTWEGYYRAALATGRLV